jgi:flagellar hook-associated protein 3 FlgL
MYRESFRQPATSTVTNTTPTINVTFKTAAGDTHYVELPVDGTEVTSGGVTYTASGDSESGYTITGTGPDDSYELTTDGNGTLIEHSDNVDSGKTTLEERGVSTISYNNGDGVITLKLPLLPAIDQTYELKVNDVDGASEFNVTVNSDGTFTIKKDPENPKENEDGTKGVEVINVTANGSVNSSYYESTLDLENIIYSTTSEEDKDAIYKTLEEDETKNAVAYLNAATGEIIMNDYLKTKLSTLPDIINAKTIAVEYDKKEWEKGDIKPENLFSCTYTNSIGKEILYNKGTAPHNIAYDVGFAQSVVVNTTADAAFTTSVKRDAEDLSSKLSEIKQLSNSLTTLKKKLDAAGDADKPTIQAKIDAAQKAYDYMREDIQREFEHKITSMQDALDVVNIAVTDNGTRSKRLDLIIDRLMTQTTTFETLKSENEDIDLAEAATKLTTAQVTYEASLMATGKISQTSLLNYL